MVDSPWQARSRLARSYIGGPPEPEVEEQLRCNLATANADKAIRIALEGGYRLSDNEVAHLVGLILMEAMADGDTVARCETYVREAVRQCRAAE